MHRKGTLNLTKRIDNKYLQKLTGANLHEIKNILQVAKRFLEIPLRTYNYSGNPNYLLYKHAKDHGFFRKSPSKEAAACNQIIHEIGLLPVGGLGLIIGTPTAYAYNDAPTWIGKPLLDNLYVAHHLEQATRRMKIVVGNAINPQKALDKITDWLSLFSKRNAIIIDDNVNPSSFEKHITFLARKNEVVKVILMMSGEWNGQSNYERVAERLIKQFAKLHIIAMTKTYRRHFSIVVLNQNKKVIIRKPLSKIERFK